MIAPRLKAFFREPVLHFLLLGAALFIMYANLNRDLAGSDPQTIVVDRDKLLTFVQYRSRAFDITRFQDLLDQLPGEDLQRLVQDYVREEALYREAKALQLDRNDYVSRLRLIQQLEFIIRGFADAQVEITEQEIQRHYEAYKAEYRVEPKVTFTHVFFSSDRHGAEKADVLARAELSKLNGGRVRFDQAPAHGERFLYHVNYVNREPEEIASHFGQDMQAKVFALEPDARRWRGPYQSPYGAHLVLLTHHEAGYLPSLEEVRARVEQEARQAALDAQFEDSVQSIVQAYKIEVNRGEFTALRVDESVKEEALQHASAAPSVGMSRARDR